VSSIGSPCYALSGFLHKILSPLAGRSDSFVKNSGHFIELLKCVNLHRQDTLVSFDVVSLFTNVPVDEALQVIRSRLEDDNTLAERSVLEVEAVMELLEVCLRTTYFQVDDGFYQQKEGMAMGNSLSPIVSNIYMEHFEQLALNSAQDKPSLWLRYVDDTFVIWPHGTERIQNFLTHLNSLRPTIQFTMEMESGGAIPFLDVLVIRKGTALTTQVYRKPTHTGRYLNFDSNHPPHVKRGIIYSLLDRAATICQDRQDRLVEVSNLKHDFQLNGYSQGFINSVIRSKGSSLRKEEDKPLGIVYIPYVKGISEKFKRIGNQYNIRTVFRTKHTLRSSLVRTRPKRDPQQTAHCVYSIPCECGRRYIGETGRPMTVRIREHMHNLKQGLIEKSKLAQHAYEEGHRVNWDEARVLEIESNSRYRKYKESAYIACTTNPISQPSLDISPIWIPLIKEEVNKSNGS
jgi:predicted GIY-YIG superfamily endonuclease